MKIQHFVNKRKYALNLRTHRQLWKGEIVSTLDEFEDYEPQIPEPFINARIELKVKQDLIINYSVGNKSYDHRKESI